MSSLHPKFTVSVYQPGVEFNNDAFDTRRGFAIHTVKSTDPPQDFSTMYQSKYYNEKLKESAARKLYHENLQKSLNETRTSLWSQSQAAQSPSSTESKLKSKLQKDMDLANQYNAETEPKEEEVKQRDSVTSRPADGDNEYQLGKSIKSSRKESTSLMGSPKNKFVKSFNPSATSPSWMRSSRGGTSPDFIKLRSKSSALKKTLYYDSRINSIPKTSVKNDVIEGLIENEDLIMSNPALLESVVKLRDMQLLKTKVPGVNRFKGVGKINYVYNDFHSRSTNPGYSRKEGGSFYFR